MYCSGGCLCSQQSLGSPVTMDIVSYTIDELGINITQVVVTYRCSGTLSLCPQLHNHLCNSDNMVLFSFLGCCMLVVSLFFRFGSSFPLCCKDNCSRVGGCILLSGTWRTHWKGLWFEGGDKVERGMGEGKQVVMSKFQPPLYIGAPPP